MPQISISNDMALAALKRVFSPFDINTLYPSATGVGYATFGWAFRTAQNGNEPGVNDDAYRYTPRIRLMKGTVPTYQQLTGTLSRDTDALVTWYPQTTNRQNGWIDDGATPTIYLQNTELSYAYASGTATWAWMQTQGYDGTPNTGWYSTAFGLSYAAVAFTVGLPGSGSDLEMTSTDIIAGRGYRLLGAPKITIATEFNY